MTKNPAIFIAGVSFGDFHRGGVGGLLVVMVAGGFAVGLVGFFHRGGQNGGSIPPGIEASGTQSGPLSRIGAFRGGSTTPSASSACASLTGRPTPQTGSPTGSEARPSPDIQHAPDVKRTPAVTRRPDGHQVIRRPASSPLDVAGRAEQPVDPTLGPVSLQKRDSGKARALGFDFGFYFEGGQHDVSFHFHWGGSGSSHRIFSYVGASFVQTGEKFNVTAPEVDISAGNIVLGEYQMLVWVRDFPCTGVSDFGVNVYLLHADSFHFHRGGSGVRLDLDDRQQTLCAVNSTLKSIVQIRANSVAQETFLKTANSVGISRTKRFIYPRGVNIVSVHVLTFP